MAANNKVDIPLQDMFDDKFSVVGGNRKYVDGRIYDLVEAIDHTSGSQVALTRIYDVSMDGVVTQDVHRRARFELAIGDDVVTNRSFFRGENGDPANAEKFRSAFDGFLAHRELLTQSAAELDAIAKTHDAHFRVEARPGNSEDYIEDLSMEHTYDFEVFYKDHLVKRIDSDDDLVEILSQVNAHKEVFDQLDRLNAFLSTPEAKRAMGVDEAKVTLYPFRYSQDVGFNVVDAFGDDVGDYLWTFGTIDEIAEAGHLEKIEQHFRGWVDYAETIRNTLGQHEVQTALPDRDLGVTITEENVDKLSAESFDPSIKYPSPAKIQLS